MSAVRRRRCFRYLVINMAHPKRTPNVVPLKVRLPASLSRGNRSNRVDRARVLEIEVFVTAQPVG